MKQVQYGSDLTEALTALGESTNDDGVAETLRTSLSAQLSHSEGIRGFMVSYLTGSYESSTNEDDGSIDAAAMVATEQDPRVLLETLHGLVAEEAASSNEDELVPLMCMNVVMPIAMITMHQDPALSEASRLTAARGIRLLGSVVGASASINANLEAIAEVATTEWTGATEPEIENDAPLIRYWKAFFVKWGYEDPQRKDIAAAVTELLSKASPQQ